MSGVFRAIGCTLLLALCGTSMFLDQGVRVAAAQSEDPLVDEGVVEEEEDADVEVEEEEGEDDTGEEVEAVVQGGGAAAEEEEEEEEDVLKSSTNADFVTLFTNQQSPGSTEVVAGEPVKALIGMSNKGDEDFIVTLVEGSLRYPQDFSFHIQNFSVLYYEQYVPPGTHASFLYPFVPSDMFVARTLGLVISVYYKTAAGSEFRSDVFNDTVSIVEVEEGFDGETFFMYVFMISGLCLLMFVVHYVYTTAYRKGGSGRKAPQVEMGTQGKDEVDYNWLPPSTLAAQKKSPRPSPSPRKRKSGK